MLLWSVWSLAAKPLPVLPSEALPVDIVSVSEFTQMTAGDKSAPKAEAAKPLVEKVAEATPVEDVTAKVVEKKEVKAAREPPPEAKPVESKPTESKPEKKQAEAKPDPIAEALAKEEAKKPEPKKAEAKPPVPPKKPEPKVAEAKPPVPPKKPAPPAPKFDPNQVQALLNKQNATRLAAAGATLNSAPVLGTPKGTAPQMSLSELDALRQRLSSLWNVQCANPDEIRVVVRFQLKRDRTLAGRPEVLNSGTSARWLAAKDSAWRAVYAGQPYDMLRPESYEAWSDMEITFDPREMFGGC